jgi:hypothetical protein
VNFIKPVISEQKASEIFSKKRSFLKRSPGKIANLELIYLPYYTFGLTISTKKGEKKVSVSIDGIKGTFAFLNLDGVATSKREGNFFNFEFSYDEAEKIAKSEYRGIILQSGLLAKATAELKDIKRTKEIYYPYWICYYKKGDLYNFRALDAVSGKFEGVKMNPVFLHAFSQKTS